MITNNQNLEEKEIVENLELSAKKLALLLHHSNMPDEIKESWISLLPSMSLSQIDRFLNILEAKYLDEQTGNIDEKYKKKIEDLISDYLNENLKDKSELLDKISKI